MRKKAKDNQKGDPPTWGLLAKRLQVSTNAIREWRKLPGAPDSMAYDAWKAFVAENNLGVTGNRVSSRREELLVGTLERKNRLADLEIARKEGRMVERAAVETRDVAIFTKQKAVLFAALESEYPGKVVGRTAAEVRVLGRRLAERICDIFSQDIERWQWPSD